MEFYIRNRHREIIATADIDIKTKGTILKRGSAVFESLASYFSVNQKTKLRAKKKKKNR